MSDFLNDLQMAGGEIAYRVTDVEEIIDKIPQRLRKKLERLAKESVCIVDELGKIRQELGLPERPEN